MNPRTSRVLFAAAAGPRLGFGHLVRCGILAEALGLRRHAIVLRGSVGTSGLARQRGWTVDAAAGVLSRLRPALLVVDDPSPERTARWVRLARSHRIAVATVHDGGSASARADLKADLRIDGRAILHPAIATHRARVTHVRPSGRVIIALGGGVHVRRSGAAIAAAVATAVPGIRINLATGFAPGGRRPSLPAGCRWVHAPNGLAALLASASVAVVAGGLTLYEACALGTPAVAVPVVPAQRAAIRAMASARAVLAVRAVGRDRTVSPSAVASSVAALLANPTMAADLGRRARQLVDAGGAARAAARLGQLLTSPQTEAARHA